MPADHAGPLDPAAPTISPQLRAVMGRFGARSVRRVVPSWEEFRRKYPDAPVQQLRRGEMVDPGALTDLSLLYAIELDDSTRVRPALDALRGTAGVVFAHRNSRVGLSAPLVRRPFVSRQARANGFRLFSSPAPSSRLFDLTPNDPAFVSGGNWGFHNAGYPNADVQAPQAWGIQTGSPDVIIGILDTGIDSLHTDMMPGTESKVYRQWDFVHNDANAYPDGGYDNPSHGVAVAGIAGAHTNDGFGSAGLCGGNSVLTPGCRIAAAKILGSGTIVNGVANWLGWETDIADAVIWTANQGAVVVNNSWCHYRGFWGGENYSHHAAMRNVAQVGILVTAAMGNSDGTCNQNAPNEDVAPAAFSDIVAAVGATNYQGNRVSAADNLGWQSATGPHISVVAPSPGHITDVLGNATGAFSGTSAATPFVSGLAGLLWSEIRARSMPLYGNDVRRIMELTARDLDVAGWDPNTGHGRIDAHKALLALQPPNELLTATLGPATSSCYSLTGWTNWAWWASFTTSVVRRCEVRRTVTFPRAYLTAPLVWGRPVSGGGVTPSNPNSEVYYTGVVNGTVTTTGAVLKTYVYQRSDGSWWPAAASNVSFAYAVLGTPQPPPAFVVSADAPGYVTVKSTYDLLGSANAPATNWEWQQSYDGGPYSFWSSNQNSSFVAYAGQYTLDWRLTARRSSDGARDTAYTTTIVCIPSSPDCIPLARRQGIAGIGPEAPDAGNAARVERNLTARAVNGLYGSGLWLSREATQGESAVMLYSLTGNHDAWTDRASWPNGLRLSTTSIRRVPDLGLIVRERASPVGTGMVATIELAVASRGSDLRLSYAVDPDIGTFPHDDRLEWHQGIGVAVVLDPDSGAFAFGWAGTPDAARATVREYGAGDHQAPDTPARAFHEQRAATRVLGARGDVRFSVTLPPQRFAGSRTVLRFVEARGRTAAAAIAALLETRAAVAQGDTAVAAALETPTLAVRQFYGEATPGFSRVGALNASLVGTGASASDVARVRAQGITALVMSVGGAAPNGELTVVIRDTRGRIVRRINYSGAAAGDYVFQWDRRNDAGDRVSPGLYQAVVRFGGHERRTSFVVTR